MRPGTSALKNDNHTDNATVLTSWKDIARYMGKGVRTVQRWEQDFGLPVRRPDGSSKKAVLARPRDLDLWVAMRCSSRAEIALKSHAQPSTHGNSVSRQNYPVSLGALCSLNAQIEAARILQDNNRVLLREVSAQLSVLRSQIVNMSSGR
jgi:hypothetical protein